MSAKKKPAKRLPRKSIEAFDSALEPPASKQTIPVAVVTEEGVVVSSEDFDDEYEEYAPSPDNVPLAAGETQETAIKPGGWHSYGYPEPPKDTPSAPEPEPEEAVTAETAFAAPPELLEAPQKEAVALDPTFIYETLHQLVDAIEFLAKRVKNLQPKDRTILTLRIERARKLQRSLK